MEHAYLPVFFSIGAIKFVWLNLMGTPGTPQTVKGEGKALVISQAPLLPVELPHSLPPPSASSLCVLPPPPRDCLLPPSCFLFGLSQPPCLPGRLSPVEVDSWCHTHLLYLGWVGWVGRSVSSVLGALC